MDSSASSSNADRHIDGILTAMNRRDALTALGALAGAAAIAPLAAAQQDQKTLKDTPPKKDDKAAAPMPPHSSPGWDAAKGEYILPPLPYDYKALEPHIDAETMKIHHDIHHAGYVKGANKALAELAAIRAGKGDAGLTKALLRDLAFNASGHVNHTLFWMTMAPPDKGGGGKPSGELAKAIDRDFGSYDAFVAQFQAAATQVEGGGWAWLCHEPMSDKLVILQCEKQQDLTIWGVHPLLGVDVWEHAYYLKYQNKRADYVKAFMNVINWKAVEAMFGKM